MENFVKTLLKKRWAGTILIVLIGIIAYHNCLPNEMFWDDDDFINNNRYIKDLHYWPLWFTQNAVAGSYLVSNYWRPLLLAVFAIEWQWWHNWVYGWHAVSVGVHILAAIVLYFLLNKLFTRNLLALLTALLFVSHPILNEAVVYVNSMGDPLSTFFVLASLLLFTCFRQSKKPAWGSIEYWASLLFFPLGILSKETGLVLAGLLPLMDFLLLSKAKTFGKRVEQTLAAAWPFILLGITYIVLRGTTLNFSNSFNFYNASNPFTMHPGIRLMTFFKVMVQYAGFLFFPHQLRVERDLAWAQSWMAWDVLAGGLLVGYMLYAAIKYWKTKPLVSFGIGWFFIAIAPTSNVLVIINSVIYEHFLYIPMIGIALIVVDLGLDWGQKHNIIPTLLKIFAVIMALFCAINIHRNFDWRTSIGFYEQLITYQPHDYRVINNLGMEYANKKIYDKAQTYYLKAIALYPKDPVAYHNLAEVYRNTGHLQLALENFQKAIELDPDFIFSRRALAELYWQLGLYEECRKSLLQILLQDPTDYKTRQALQMVQEKLEENPSSQISL